MTTADLQASILENGIQRAAIIDDAYDLPSVNEEDWLALWTVVSDDEEKLAALREYGSEPSNEHDLNDELLEELWAKRDQLGPLEGICRETIFRDSFQRLESLQLVRECISSLGIETIDEIGSSGFPDSNVDLIFLDFSLDDHLPRMSEEDIVDPEKLSERVKSLEVPKKSCDKAQEIWNRAEDEKPFIVLISDHPEAKYMKDRFLVESTVLGGLFGFIPKPDFAETESTMLQLASWGIGNPDCHSIQSFVNAAVESVDAVAQQFRKIIRQFDVHDYSHIERIALNSEGHPLGDYMLWLFDAILSHEFRSHMTKREEQSRIDKLRFKNCLPCSRASVGKELARAYWKAQTIPTTELAAHPWCDHDNPDGPLYALGDLFIAKSESAAYVVINAPCSLRFVPGEDSKRPFDPDLSIVLIPGQLVSGSNFAGTAPIVTEFVEFDGETYSIAWDLDRAISVPNGESFNFLHSKGYERIARLRPLYALEIKNGYLAHLGRLGTPVTPPVMELRDVKVYVKQGADYVPQGKPISDGYMGFIAEQKAHFLLTVPVVDGIMQALRIHNDCRIQTLESKLAALDAEVEKNEEKEAGLRTKLAECKALKPEVSEWLDLTKVPRKAPTKGKAVQVGQFSVSLRVDNEPEANDTPVVLVAGPLDENIQGVGDA